MSLKKWKKSHLSQMLQAKCKREKQIKGQNSRTSPTQKQITVFKFLWQEIDDHIWNNKNLWAVSKADGERL